MTEGKNTELKQKYIDTYKYNNVARLLFKKAVDYEQKYNKDLAEFNHEEILDYLTSIGCGCEDTLFAYVSTIRGYARFYTEKTGADTMAWETTSSDSIRPCVRKEKEFKYIPPAVLDEVVELIPNPMDQFLVKGIYEGLKGDFYEELWNLRIDDINPTTLVARLPTGRRLTISPELYAIALKSDETEDYVSLKGTNSWVNYKMIDNRIIKYRSNSTKVDNPTSQKIKIANRIYDLKKYTGREEINAIWLRKSGAIYMIKKEAARLNIKEIDVIDHSVFNTIRERYGLKLSTAIYKARFRQFLNS